MLKALCLGISVKLNNLLLFDWQYISNWHVEDTPLKKEVSIQTYIYIYNIIDWKVCKLVMNT